MKKSALDTEIEVLSFVAKPEDIKALKNYIADPDADGQLKLQILEWMWDRLKDINSKNPIDRIPNFNKEVYTFLKLTGIK